MPKPIHVLVQQAFSMKGAKVNHNYNWSDDYVGTSQTDDCELTLRAALERRHVPAASCTFSPPGHALCLRGNVKYNIDCGALRCRVLCSGARLFKGG